jgi:hypothetical protein
MEAEVPTAAGCRILVGALTPYNEINPSGGADTLIACDFKSLIENFCLFDMQ